MKANCTACGESVSRSFGESTLKEMDKDGTCWSCNFWNKQAKLKHPVVIDGHIYYIGHEPTSDDARFYEQQRSNLGMAGRRFDIEFFSGRKITTHNLWSSPGEIPECLRWWIPNTAKFLGAEKAKVGEITCWNPTGISTPPYPPYK